ncbi:MAG: hypothetical protein RDU20_14805 [Desulfomonilaceae bacterium]|nr:hypothetical protein [Desulfomonilaceae bacterium]
MLVVGPFGHLRAALLRELRGKVAAGLDQLDRGEAWDLPDDIEEGVQEIQSRGRRRLGLAMLL